MPDKKLILNEKQLSKVSGGVDEGVATAIPTPNYIKDTAGGNSGSGSPTPVTENPFK